MAVVIYIPFKLRVLGIILYWNTNPIYVITSDNGSFTTIAKISAKVDVGK